MYICLYLCAHKHFEINQLPMWCDCACCLPNRLTARNYTAAHLNDWLVEMWVASGEQWEAHDPHSCVASSLNFAEYGVCGMQGAWQATNRLKWSPKWGFKSIIRTTVSNSSNNNCCKPTVIAARSSDHRCLISVASLLTIFVRQRRSCAPKRPAWIAATWHCGCNLYAHIHFVRRLHM